MKKLISVLTVLAMLSCPCVASAAVHTQNPDWDLTKSYANKNCGYCELTLNYDIGSWLPNDDANASMAVSVAAGMSGYAFTKIWDPTGVVYSSHSDVKSNNQVFSGVTTAPGQDYAEEILYQATRQNSNGNTEKWSIDVT